MDAEINSNTKFDIKSASNDVFEVTVESNDIRERIKRFVEIKFTWAPWTLFVRRDFIIENEIKFPNILAAEDFVFSICCLCSAKVYVRIPDILYIYRVRKNSITINDFSLDKTISKWVKGFCNGIESLDKFMSKIDFFNQNFEIKYMILDFFIQFHIQYTSWLYSKFPPHVINNLVRSEVSKFDDKNMAFISQIFDVANFYHTRLKFAQQEINQLRQQINDLKEV